MCVSFFVGSNLFANKTLLNRIPFLGKVWVRPARCGPEGKEGRVRPSRASPSVAGTLGIGGLVYIRPNMGPYGIWGSRKQAHMGPAEAVGRASGLGRRGVAAEKNGRALFPYEVTTFYQCPACATAFHQTCFRRSGECPVCVSLH